MGPLFRAPDHAQLLTVPGETRGRAGSLSGSFKRFGRRHCFPLRQKALGRAGTNFVVRHFSAARYAPCLPRTHEDFLEARLRYPAGLPFGEVPGPLHALRSSSSSARLQTSQLLNDISMSWLGPVPLSLRAIILTEVPGRPTRHHACPCSAHAS
jgi:hypothetical protein